MDFSFEVVDSINNSWVPPAPRGKANALQSKRGAGQNGERSKKFKANVTPILKGIDQAGLHFNENI